MQVDESNARSAMKMKNSPACGNGEIGLESCTAQAQLPPNFNCPNFAPLEFLFALPNDKWPPGRASRAASAVRSGPEANCLPFGVKPWQRRQRIRAVHFERCLPPASPPEPATIPNLVRDSVQFPAHLRP